MSCQRPLTRKRLLLEAMAGHTPRRARGFMLIAPFDIGTVHLDPAHVIDVLSRLTTLANARLGVAWLSLWRLMDLLSWRP